MTHNSVNYRYNYQQLLSGQLQLQLGYNYFLNTIIKFN